MPSETPRPHTLRSLLLLIVVIAVGAHISGIPLLLAKAGIAPVLCLAYGYFAVRLVTPMRIGSAGVRAFAGLLLGVGTMYLTWAIRIPAFSGWETPFVAHPEVVFEAILERAKHMEVTRGFGGGTSTSGPSWLLLGTYIAEAFFLIGAMVLGALLSDPPKPAAQELTEEGVREAA